MPLLNPGDPFPRLMITATDGQALTVPDAFAGDFAVVLFYRGACAIGRLVPDDVVGLVHYLREHPAPATA
jgi:hypothetical protein